MMNTLGIGVWMVNSVTNLVSVVRHWDDPWPFLAHSLIAVASIAMTAYEVKRYCLSGSKE